jgi:hypothetical protein
MQANGPGRKILGQKQASVESQIEMWLLAVSSGILREGRLVGGGDLRDPLYTDSDARK